MRWYLITLLMPLCLACAADPGVDGPFTHTTGNGTAPHSGGPPSTAGDTATTTSPPLQGLTIVAANANNLCVGTDGTAAGANVLLQTCNGTATQRWIVEDVGLKTLDGLCLDTADGSQTNGSEKLVLSACSSNHQGQVWGLYKGLIYATPNPNWVAFAPSNDNVSANTAIVMAPYNAADAAQHWVLNVTAPARGGAMSVTGFPIVGESDPNTCLSAAMNNIETTPCTGAQTQTWIWNDNGGLAWGADTGLCLDVSAGNPNVTAGTAAVLLECNNMQTQWWLAAGNLTFHNENLATSGSLESANYNWSWGR